MITVYLLTENMKMYHRGSRSYRFATLASLGHRFATCQVKTEEEADFLCGKKGITRTKPKNFMLDEIPENPTLAATKPKRRKRKTKKPSPASQEAYGGLVESELNTGMELSDDTSGDC